MEEQKEVETPPGFKTYILVSYELKNLKPIKKIEVSHKLYGHAQMKNGKRYEFGGIIKSMKGLKVGKGGLLLPAEFREDIIRFFDGYSIKHQMMQVYRKEA